MEKEEAENEHRQRPARMDSVSQSSPTISRPSATAFKNLTVRLTLRKKVIGKDMGLTEGERLRAGRLEDGGVERLRAG